MAVLDVALSLLLGAMPLQTDRDRVCDLDEEQAAGKVRWLVKRMEDGVLTKAEASRQVLEGFQHALFTVRGVVVEHLDQLDRTAVRRALGTELRRFAAEMVKIDAPDGPLPGGKDSLGRGREQVLIFVRRYAETLFAAAASHADDAIADAVCSCDDANMPPDPLLAIAPALVKCLSTVRTRACMEHAVEVYQRVEKILMYAIEVGRKKGGKVYLPLPMVGAEDTLRAMHACMAAAFSGTQVISFSETKPSAPAFRRQFRATKSRFPERVASEKSPPAPKRGSDRRPS